MPGYFGVSIILLTILVHAGLFWCCHNPPNSDMDCSILNVSVRSFSMCIHSVVEPSLMWGSFTLCMHMARGPWLIFSSERLLQSLPWRHTEEIFGMEGGGCLQSLACNGHPSTW